MPNHELERSQDPRHLPIYRHLTTALTLAGIGGILLRGSHLIIGVLLLIGAAVYVVLAVRSVLVRRRN